MSRRSPTSQPINLFAFLDILICTMGALILMLMVVTTRQLRKESLAEVLAEFKNPPPPLLSVESSEPAATETTTILAQPEPEPEPAEPEHSEPAVDPRETARAERAAALAQRERELNELLEEWRRKTSELTDKRDQHANALAQRRRLQEAASQQVAALQSEEKELEAKLGGLTSELTATKVGDSTEQERKQIEQQIAAVQKRLKAAQVATAGGESKFMVVPFDPQSGTSRRPILIECTEEGLRFIPENVVIKPDDLEGFTARVNPLLAGSNSLVSYWTAWNLKQPQPAPRPEPYVLMLVRPSGTVAYYVAMRMLETLKQPHGYELIEEDTQLQQPALDPGAQAVCEAAVKRLLAERNQILKSARSGSGGGFARGIGSKGDAFRSGSGSGIAKGSSSNRFEVTDATGGEDEVGSRSWERIENFAGRSPRRDGAGKNPSDMNGTKGSPASNRALKGDGDELGSDGLSVGRNGQRADEVGQPNAIVEGEPKGSRSQSGREGNSSASTTDSGIERLEGAGGSGSASGVAGSSAGSPAGGQAGRESPLDIGLGSAGPTPIAVEDRRTKNKSANTKPIEPEQFTRKRWGLSAPDAAIGLEREVCIEVESTRLVIAGKHAVRMGEGESKQETFERIVTVLDLQARDWGQPPQGFFWKPSLRFVVAKDGNPNYEQARALAERAGLTTSKEYAGDSTAKPSRSGATGEGLRSPVLLDHTGGTKPPPVAPARTPGSPVPMTSASKPVRVTPGGAP